MALIVAVCAVPVLASVGVGVDVARMVNAKTVLHNATDAAALAGATLYTSAANQAAAQSSGQTYFDNYAASPGLTVSGVTITTTPWSGTATNKVTVTATATIPTSLMQIAGVKTLTVSSTSTAGIQAPQTLSLQPIIIAAPGTGSSSQVASGTLNGSSAADWNSAYMYGVPKAADGTWDYNAIPALSTMYEIGSNCGPINSSYSAQSSMCKGLPRSVPPATQTFTVDPDQPIAFLFLNMNSGNSTLPQQYPHNSYGAYPGYFEVMTTASMSIYKNQVLQGPTMITDDSVSRLGLLGVLNKNGQPLIQGPTTYSTVNKSINNNCALQIALVTDMNNVPTSPPHVGSCFPVGANDGGTGSQYANLSCNQIGNRTFIYWWNDMGWLPDDFDYKNLYYLVSCRQGTNNPDGGTIGHTTLPPPQPPAPVAKLLQ